MISHQLTTQKPESNYLTHLLVGFKNGKIIGELK